MPLSSVPEVFVHEYSESKPLYYKGYRRVKANPGKVDEVKGVGVLHSILVTGMLDQLMIDSIRQQHWICPGRPGLRVNPMNLFCIDFAVISKEKLPSQAITNGFLQVPPELTVEVDVSVVCERFSERDYINRKVDRMLQFGTRRIVWIFLAKKCVLIAEPGKAKITLPFTEDFEMINGISFNIIQFAQSNGLIYLK